MERTAIIGGHGFGDCILALQVAKTIEEKTGSMPDIFISTRDEIFYPLVYSFFEFDIHKIEEHYSSSNGIINFTKDEISDILNMGYRYDNIYYVIPDLLYKNKYAFDFAKFNSHPQVINKKRLIEKDWAPEKQIYLGLISSTEGYTYPYVNQLVDYLAVNLPDYKISIPIIDSWAGKKITLGDNLTSSYGNVEVRRNPTFEDELEIISKSCYGIYADNGPSHYAYQLGQPRILLDPRLNKTPEECLPWIARWRETVQESLPIDCSPSRLAQVVKTNIEIPQTCLLPRSAVWNNIGCDWDRKLLFKNQ